MRSTTTSGSKKHIRLWAVLLWLTVWQLAGMWVGQEFLLATPAATARALLRLMGEGEFWRSIAFSLSRIAAGFGLAAVLAVALGVLAARRKWVGDLLAPLLAAVKATPVASFVIVALIWVSSRNLSVLISFLMVFPVLYLSIREAVEQLEGELAEMARVFRVPLGRRVRYLYLPEILPRFRAAASAALGYCWKAGVAAEVIGIPDGSLGEKLYEAKIYLNTPELFAWTVTIVAVSAATEKLALWLLRLAEEKWGRM
ncbi:MAG: ABC transporter permease [Oscillospiraceae bacterium]